MKPLLILLIIGLILPIASHALVFSNPLGGSFGGRILSVIPCTCFTAPPFIPSLWITVGSPAPASLIYTPGISTLYKNYSVYTGRWALGTSSTTRPCLQQVTVFPAPACVPIGQGSLIRKIGSSLF